MLGKNLLVLTIGIGLGILVAGRTYVVDAQGVVKQPVDVPAEIAGLKNKEADQAHAMVDVAYHFGNLWFAGQKKNWPLAEFYLGETKSHLRWAVRIKPLRQDAEKREIKLTDILTSLENAPLKDLQSAIGAKDSDRFEKTYRAMLDGCYACHKASAKAMLHPTIPSRPPEAMMQFEPEETK